MRQSFQRVYVRGQRSVGLKYISQYLGYFSSFYEVAYHKWIRRKPKKHFSLWFSCIKKSPYEVMSAAVSKYIVSWLFWFYLHLQHYFTCYSAYKRLPTKKEAYDVHLLALFNLCCFYEGLLRRSAKIEMLNYEVNFLLFAPSHHLSTSLHVIIFVYIKNEKLVRKMLFFCHWLLLMCGLLVG